VKVLLHDDVTSAGECCVLLGDPYGIGQGLAGRILRAVHESNQIAVIEVLESVHLIRRRDGSAQSNYDLRRKFEA
jgi:hypothetical protein